MGNVLGNSTGKTRSLANRKSQRLKIAICESQLHYSEKEFAVYCDSSPIFLFIFANNCFGLRVGCYATQNS